jgi:hypothetical protein
MRAKFFYSLVSAVVVGGFSLASSAVILTWVPEGKPRDMAEQYFTASGKALERNKTVRRWRKKADKQLESAQERIEEAAEDLKIPHLYNAASWSVVGFVLCFVMTLLFGISSMKSALALGVKASLTLLFLQAALVFGGILAYQRLG